MTKAVVIGGCGFLGSHLARDLVDAGISVTLADLRPPLPNSSVSDLISSYPSLVDFKHLNVTDIDEIMRVLDRVDIVFHCASPPYSLNDRKLFYDVNVNGTMNLIEACKKVGVKKLVLTSSCSVIYTGADLKFADESVPYPEQHLDYYTETKMLQEQLVLNANSRDFFTTAIRPHGIFGPNDPHLVPEIVAKAKQGKMKFMIGDGTNIVDFTYVKNVSHGHVLAAQHLGPNGIANGKAYIITNDEPIQFWTFLSILLQRLDYDPPTRHIPYALLLVVAYIMQFFATLFHFTPFLTPFKVSLAGTHHYYSCERAKKELGYKPKVSLKDAIDETIETCWSLRNPDAKTVAPIKEE